MTITSVLHRGIPVVRRPMAGAVKLAIVALGASALAGTVQAQDTEQSTEKKKSRYSVQLEEVVVTAQKREEDFMLVPVAVNAFTAQDMVNTGAVNIQDIDDFMPGVEISNGQSTQVDITIRGISSPTISSGGDPSVATFFDGSYMPRAVTSIPFTDIARTEVLKGPQGTLFGRNATAGVVNIIPNRPSDEFEGFVKARVGNYNLLRLEGMVNAPISDSVAVRGNIFSHQRDGITENVGIGGDLQDEDFLSLRGSVLFNLSDYTDLQISADYEDRDEMPPAGIGVGKYAYQGSTDPFSGKTALDARGREETREMYGVSMQLNHDFGNEWSMFGIVSYRDWETTNLNDEEGTADARRYLTSDNIEESDIWYSELRFNYTADRINVIAGGNYSQEEVYQRTDVGLLADSYMQALSIIAGPDFGFDLGPDDHLWEILPPSDEFYLFASDLAGVAVLPPSFSGVGFAETMDNTGEFVNWGIFTDATYQLTDTVRIAAGLRYSYDDKEYSWQTFSSGLDWPYEPERLVYNPVDTGADPANYLDKFTDSDDWNKTTGRLVADWEFTENAMTYLSYATGYKSGGWDGQLFSSYASGSFAPEEITNIEWGLKGDFFDNSLRMELAVFHQELDGRQVSASVKDSPDDPTAQPGVISRDEEADGVEIMVTWTPTDSLRLTGLTTYRESESTSQEYYNSAGELTGGEKEDGETDTDYTLRMDWTPDIPVGFLLVHVDYIFNEDPGPDADTVIYETGPWYFNDRKMLNARIAWSNDADTIEVALWGANLLDEENASNPGGYVADLLGAAKTDIEDPLTWGVDLRYSF